MNPSLNSADSTSPLPPAVITALLVWWQRTVSDTATGSAKADRAMLRRCANPTEVACSAAYQRAYQALKAAHTGPAWRSWQQDRLAAIVGLAAHIRPGGHSHGPQALTLPQAMHQQPAGSDRPRVSELRFQRLLAAPDVDSLYTGLRRILPLIDHQTDPAALARDLFWWNETTKKHWAYAYYDTPRAQPAEASSVTTADTHA